MTYFIVYVSSATTLMTDQELNAILDQSRRNNERRSVTGAMLYQDGNIMQVLEGDLDTVEDLYQTIANDSRHRNLTRIYDGWSAERQFGDWSMAFGNLSRTSTVTGIGTDHLLAQPPDEYGSAVARMLLASFRSTLNLRGTPV